MKPKHCHIFIKKKVDLEQKIRPVCKICGFIDYNSPKVSVGSLIVKNNKFLLCKRAIEPGYGLWSLPSGFVDGHEDIQKAVIREAREEANINIKIKKLMAIFSVTKKNIIQIIFLAEMIGKKFKPGIESLEVRFFSYKDIPWKKLAFVNVEWILKFYKKNKKTSKNDVFLRKD